MNLNELVLYDSLAQDPIIESYVALLNTAYMGETRKAYFELVKKLLSVGMVFEAYFFRKLVEAENVVLERMSHDHYMPTALDIACLRNDLAILEELVRQESEEKIREADDRQQLLKGMMFLKKDGGALMAYKDFFHDAHSPAYERYEAYINLLKTYGTGEFAVHDAYYVDQADELVPVAHFEPLGWDHIYDYAFQKEKLIQNTQALVEGRPFHHALLVGASGTGKSSSVKAVADLFSDRKLRLLQLYKGQMRNLPWIMKKLSSSTFRFVIFIDDLSFEVNEDDYKLLKSYIEGGVVNEASNIAFYVTSNRQHLIKEDRSDREGDIHIQDFIQEMTSLSRRFGLRLTYDKLTQKAYFDMVAKMLEDEDIVYERQEMEAEAKKWSMRHSGMSGRIAAQFVMDLQMRKG